MNHPDRISPPHRFLPNSRAIALAFVMREFDALVVPRVVESAEEDVLADFGGEGEEGCWFFPD